MLEQIWEFIVHNGLLVVVVLFFFVRICFRGSSGAMPEHPGNKVTDVKSRDEWEAEMSKAKDDQQLVVADFYATWCGPCRAAAPTFGKMSIEFDDIKFLKVDVDSNRTVAMENNINAMPTFILFKKGKKVDQMMGWSESKLRTLIQKYK